MNIRSAILFFLSFIIIESFAQCNDDFNLGNDTSLCNTGFVNLSIPNIYDDYTWQDNSTLNTFQVNGPGTYYCVANLASNNNLISNGDFEIGNTLFTTDYTYYPIADVFGPQASYGIISNANTWFNPFNACTDHTTGGGLMMVIDGSAFNGGNDAIWCQDVFVQGGSKYRFSYWIQSVTNSTILANIQVRINGVVVDLELAPSGACNWQEREIEWTSTTTGNVSFCLYDLELAGNGNDFALDDISLVQVCEYTDTLIVDPSPIDTNIIAQEICPGDSFFVGGAWQLLPGFYYDLTAGAICNEVLETELIWSAIDTSMVSEKICPGDSFFVEGAWQTLPGLYYDFMAGIPCDGVLETALVLRSLDTTSVTEEICELDSFFVGGQWQKNAGAYYDFVSGNPCDEVLETTLIINALPNANAGNDVTVSYEQIVTLSAIGGSASESYLWASSNNFSSTDESIDVEVISTIQNYYLQVTSNGCSNADTVIIYGIPLNLAIRVPNAFTPNLDGVNDVFRLVNPDEFEQILIKVYNRWGEMIYLDEGGNPSWNGEYLNSKKCANGTYVFYIEASPFGNVEKMNLSGNLSLIR